MLSVVFKQGNNSNVGVVKHFGNEAFKVGFDPDSYMITLYEMSQYLVLCITSHYQFTMD